MRIARLLLILILVAAPLAAEGQPLGKISRIGYLGLAAPTPEVLHLVEGLRQGLRELGYVEGRNISVEYRWAEGDPERLAALAHELARLGVDVIVAGTTLAALAAKHATTTIPIVIPVTGDPVVTGLVSSLARPGGNVTGLTNISPELSAKRLELLKEIVPRVERVAVLRNVEHPPAALQFKETELAARALGVELQSLEVRGPNPDLEGVFRAATRSRVGALIILEDPLTLSHRTRIVGLAATNRLPAISEFAEFAKAGGLISYGPSIPDQFRRAASYVDKILKGAKPADLPMERPTRFELVINLRTAKALGLTIPPSVLVRADEVIQ